MTHLDNKRNKHIGVALCRQHQNIQCQLGLDTRFKELCIQRYVDKGLGWPTGAGTLLQLTFTDFFHC